MNLLVIYLVLLVILFLFLIMFFSYYRQLCKLDNTNQTSSKINSVQENFIVTKELPAQCSSDVNNVFFKEDGYNVEMCYNFIDREKPKKGALPVEKIYSGNTMYRFNPDKKGYIYYVDYLDNHFDIELYIEFINLEGLQTILDTKFYNLSMYGTQMIITSKFGRKKSAILYNFKPPKQPPPGTDTINDHRFELSVKQVKQKEKILLSVKDLDSPVIPGTGDRLVRSTSIDMTEEQLCDYSSGNDFFIGCTKDKEKYLNAYLGIKSVSIDKTFHDKYVYGNPSQTIPSNIKCEISKDETSTTDTATTTAVARFNTPNNYLEIKIDNAVKDYKIKYKTSVHTDNVDITTTNQKNIYDFFNILRTKDDMYEIPTYLRLQQRADKESYFFKSYDNRDTFNNSPFISYILDLKTSSENQNIIEKLYFFDNKEINKYLKSYENVYLMIMGSRTERSSYFQFLNMNKPVCIVIFKNKLDINYEYKIIKIDINLYYIFQRDYLIYIKKFIGKIDVNDRLFSNFFMDFLNSRKGRYRFDQDMIDSSTGITPIFNNTLYKVYNTDFMLNISVNIFENRIIESSAFINEFRETPKDTCDYQPSGETIFDCKQKCKDEGKCKTYQCDSLCNNCETTNCKWTLVDLERQKLFVPSKARIKGFSGDRFVKLTWIRPFTKHGIEAYYIVKEQPQIDNKFDLFVFKSESELLEYTIKNLENDNIYVFYILSKNKFGVSELSNQISLIPDKNKLLTMEDLNKSYSNSIQNYYKDNYNRDINVSEQLKEMYNMAEINELKEIIVDKLTSKKDLDSYNLNVY